MRTVKSAWLTSPAGAGLRPTTADSNDRARQIRDGVLARKSDSTRVSFGGILFGERRSDETRPRSMGTAAPSRPRPRPERQDVRGLEREPVGGQDEIGQEPVRLDAARDKQPPGSMKMP